MRIYLRELSKSDIPELNLWRNNHETIDLLGSPFRFVDESIDNYWFESYQNNRATNVRLAVCENGKNTIIGAVYLLGIDWLSRSTEFAIWFGNEKARGKGLGSEATRLALHHAFNDLNLNRVYLTLLESNLRALALYKKVGFKEEGILRQATFKNGSYQNLLSMSILKEEYVDI